MSDRNDVYTLTLADSQVPYGPSTILPKISTHTYVYIYIYTYIHICTYMYVFLFKKISVFMLRSRCNSSKDRFLVFGGHQPHECIGKYLALVELQLFARILCRDYDFEAGNIIYIYMYIYIYIYIRICICMYVYASVLHTCMYKVQPI